MKTRIAYLRAVNGLPLEVQRDMAKAAKCTLQFEHGDCPGMDSRALWIARLTPHVGEKPDCIAWVPRLDVIAKRKSELGRRVRVATDLSATIADLLRRGIVIEDAARGVTSEDDGFSAALAATLQSGQNTPRDPEMVGASLVKARKARAKRGIVRKWCTKGYRERFLVQRALWTSNDYTSDQQAIAALDPDLRGLSAASIKRIFKCGRRPARKGMGGRKPKS